MTSRYVSVFAASARRAWQAPSALLMTTVFYIAVLFVFAALWKAATNAAVGSISGYDYGAIMWYLTISEGVVFAAPSRRIENIGEAISDGTIETELLRPASVLAVRVASELGEAISQLLFLLPAGITLTTLLVGKPHTIATIPFALVSIFLAVGCNWLMIHLFGALAFWVRETKAAWFLYQKLVFLPGGMLLPLQMLPHWLESISWLTPFWAMAYAPARLIAGHNDFWLLPGQLGWLAFVSLMTAFVFSRGERRLMGAR